MYNKVTLIGRLGKDAECASEKHPVKFTIATSENFKDENEESGWRTETTWHNITLWGKPEYRKGLVDRLKKGMMVLVEGKIKTSQWEDQDGNQRRSNDITAIFAKPISKVNEDTSAKQAIVPVSKPKVTPVEEEIDDLPF